MFNVIKQVAQYGNSIESIATNMRINIAYIAEQYNVDRVNLLENIVDVLSQIQTDVDHNQKFDHKQVSVIAAFLAGVEELTNRLENSSVNSTRESALRVLSAIVVNLNGIVSYGASPIAKLGAQNAALFAKYQLEVKQYQNAHSGTLNSTISHLSNKVASAIKSASGSGGQQVGDITSSETTYNPNITAAQPGIM